MFCPSCGTQIPDDSAFCLKCGRSMTLAPKATAAKSDSGHSKNRYSARFVWLSLACVATAAVVGFFFEYMTHRSLVAATTLSPKESSPIVEPGSKSNPEPRVAGSSKSSDPPPRAARPLEELLPGGAKIIETAKLRIPGKSRLLVLWMLRPTRRSSGVGNCAANVEGDYWEGPANLSLVNQATFTIVNTVGIVKGSDDGTFRIPFSVPGPLYYIPQPDSDGRGVPEILRLRDFTGEGVEAQFPLFTYVACGIVSTALWGYDSVLDRAVSYSVEAQSNAGKRVGLWVDQVFATTPVRPGYWNFTWSPGHGADFSIHEEVSFDASRKVFVETQSHSPLQAVQEPTTLTGSTSTVPDVYEAKLATTKGDIVLRITRGWSPLGADRFYSLVRSGFFNGAPFFRVLPGFMAQFGISNRPELNKAWEGQRLLDDPRPYQSNKRGTVSFATTGQPNSRGTQLFINFRDNPFLDSQGFAPIGEVVQGMDIAEQFYSGYGDTSSKEGAIENGGRAYLDQYMPLVDRIIRATVLQVAAR